MDIDLTGQIDMTGPWEAVAIDPAGYVIDPHEDDMGECDSVAVVRRTAMPVIPDNDVSARMPYAHRMSDVLYRLDGLTDEPDRVRLVLAQAVAVAESLNTQYPT